MLVDNGWIICNASCEPIQAGSLLHGEKLAIVAAEPFPSQAFIQAAKGPSGAGVQPNLPSNRALIPKVTASLLSRRIAFCFTASPQSAVLTCCTGH